MPWHPTSDWEEWTGLNLWGATINGTPLIDEMFKTIFPIPGTVEPVAFRNDGSDGFFMFTAGGRYYLYDDGQVSRCDGEFTSTDDFLHNEGKFSWTIVPPQPGLEDVPWLPGY
jgi:hypothetical protein